MNQLINCPACNHKVSSDAESCPSCGHKLNDGFFEGIVKTIFWGLVGLITLVIIILAITGNGFAIGILLPFGVLIAGSFIWWLLKNPKQW